ncbi:MAG: LysR family transcriptional regulator [Anaerolineae bacterium]
MNLSQLEVLVAIVDTGSLTEAGERIGLTQSAVSYALSKLEAELGVTLLERGRQGIVITRIGEDVLAHARDVLSHIEVIRQKAARERGLAIGKLRFGCVPNVAPRLITGIIRDFQRQYPDIEFALFEGNPQELLNWLATGVINVGTVLSPEGYAMTLPLAEDELYVLVSELHPLAQQNHVTLNALMDQMLIGPKATYHLVSQLHQMQGVVLPYLRYEVSTYGTIHAMVRENMGIAITPGRLMGMQTEGIVALPLRPQLTVRIHLAANLVSPAVEAFINSANVWAKMHSFLPDNA